ncbi:MAG: hypothetical protein EOO14_12730 [Chitinophagaceae bacterium]|nr:MAG: hypothetical protein EOO14_12730 [Chitinophagaceae bacterium]
MRKRNFPACFSYKRRTQRKISLLEFHSKSNWPQQLSFLFLVLFTTAFSVTNSAPPSLCLLKKQSATIAIDWQLDATVNGVEFYHAITECGGRKIVFLKVNNKNAYKVNVSWKEVFTTVEGKEVAGAEAQKKLQLPTGEAFETSCETMTRKELVILPERVTPTYVVKIAKFNYKDIAVSRAG